MVIIIIARATIKTGTKIFCEAPVNGAFLFTHLNKKINGKIQQSNNR
jgi:hypothetical protein